jgi:hypothetical protein
MVFLDELECASQRQKILCTTAFDTSRSRSVRRWYIAPMLLCSPFINPVASILTFWKRMPLSFCKRYVRCLTVAFSSCFLYFFSDLTPSPSFLQNTVIRILLPDWNSHGQPLNVPPFVFPSRHFLVCQSCTFYLEESACLLHSSHPQHICHGQMLQLPYQLRFGIWRKALIVTRGRFRDDTVCNDHQFLQLHNLPFTFKSLINTFMCAFVVDESCCATSEKWEINSNCCYNSFMSSF